MSAVYKIKLKKGDTVVVRSGKYKGQQGVVLAVHPRDNKVTVEGVNVVKKHTKPNKQYPQGGIIEVTKPILVSKVGIYNPDTKKAARIAISIKGDERKRVFSDNKKEVA